MSVYDHIQTVSIYDHIQIETVLTSAYLANFVVTNCANKCCISGLSARSLTMDEEPLPECAMGADGWRCKVDGSEPFIFSAYFIWCHIIIWFMGR